MIPEQSATKLTETVWGLLNTADRAEVHKSQSLE